jgi:hypothetical protein
VILIARYQFATKGCLDGSEFLQELDALDAFPPGRSNFVLANFLIDPTQPPAAPNRTRTPITISNRNDLFRALRNILAGICCQHPCVLRVHGWNIRNNEGNWEIVIETDETRPFSLEEFKRLTPLDQSKFLLSVALGMLEIHCRGVLHNNIKDDAWIQVLNGRPQICNFGLLDGNPSLRADTLACRELFSHASDESSHLKNAVYDHGAWVNEDPDFQSHIRDRLEYEHSRAADGPHPLLKLSQEIKTSARPISFPFDLFFHLVHSVELWQKTAGPVDFGEALAKLTRGLDDSAKDRFKDAVNTGLATQPFLKAQLFTGFLGGPTAKRD